jgi:hypothetical protein
MKKLFKIVHESIQQIRHVVCVSAEALKNKIKSRPRNFTISNAINTSMLPLLSFSCILLPAVQHRI